MLLLVFISAFLCATEQATGPHHVIMIYPFTHVLIAVAVRDLARLVGDFSVKGRVGLVRIAVVACIAVLVFPQLVVAAGCLKSFSVTGGTGEWSDAIYQFADYAEKQGDITFLLMDWGFSTQLLVLSNGRIKKEEAFVSVIDLPSEDEKIAGMYRHLTRANSLLVFHTPRFETYPLLGIFKRALAKYGFVARVVKTFYQRDGQPIYLVCQISRPEIDSHVQAGHFFYLREAEEWDAHFGGGIDVKPTASQGKALGKHWGHDTSHFVAYRFDSPKKVADAHLYIRYAFERPGPQRYHVLFDDNYVDTLEIDGTGGFGDTAGEWRVCHLSLGPIEPGTHEFKIKPVTPFQAINLDYFYLSKGELRLESELPPRVNGHVVSAASGGKPLEIPNRAAVRLELSPAQATAGKSYLTLRVLNFDVPSIDVLYSINGKTMPPIHGWQLDENHTATVFVGLDTPRGLYRYEAIRDSRAVVPMDWIRVDAKVLVK